MKDEYEEEEQVHIDTMQYLGALTKVIPKKEK